MNPPLTETKHRLTERLEDMCRQLFPNGSINGGQFHVGSFAGEPGKSLAIHLDGPRKGQAKDWATNESASNPLEIWRLARGLDIKEAARESLEWLGIYPAIEATRRAARPTKPTPSKAEIRAREWPAFAQYPPCPVESCRQLAKQRGIPYEGITAAHLVGVLRFEKWKGQPSWFVRSLGGKRAQARRMDGKPWKQVRAKAWTLPGSEGGLIGEEFIPGSHNILLVEGGPDFLAACNLWWLSFESWIPIAFLGTSHRFNRDQLLKLKGRRVRIFVHEDKNGAGEKGATKWARQLKGVDCQVEHVFASDLRLNQIDGSPVTDLNDAFRCDADRVETFCRRMTQ